EETSWSRHDTRREELRWPLPPSWAWPSGTCSAFDQTERRPVMISRRQFAKTLGLASALGLIESQTVMRALAADRRSLGYLAHRTASAEGAWTLGRVDGAVPKELTGVLYRVAPGQKETFGVPLRQ